MPTIIGGTTGVAPAQWTTAGRPSSPLNGQLGWNTTIGGLEAWNGSAWGAVSGAPAFSAWASVATNTATGTATKLTFDTEEFDTNSNFASSRFTPTVAGYYQINAAVNSGGYYAYTLIAIYKNGVLYKNGNISSSANPGNIVAVSSIVYCNGSTDYVEIYWSQSSGVTVNTATGISQTYFNGAMVRSA